MDVRTDSRPLSDKEGRGAAKCRRSAAGVKPRNQAAPENRQALVR